MAGWTGKARTSLATVARRARRVARGRSSEAGPPLLVQVVLEGASPDGSRPRPVALHRVAIQRRLGRAGCAYV
eukprot:scaffold1206_cov388-Prasinococcus_capsulatus_cf.AAC.57